MLQKNDKVIREAVTSSIVVNGVTVSLLEKGEFGCLTVGVLKDVWASRNVCVGG